MSYKTANIEYLKEQVIERLQEKGIKVYIIDLYQEEGDYPYCVYTFDEQLMPLAKKHYERDEIIEGAYDDWSMDEDRYADDLVNTIIYRWTEKSGNNTN